jgi:hypothetical protein
MYPGLSDDNKWDMGPTQDAGRSCCAKRPCLPVFKTCCLRDPLPVRLAEPEPVLLTTPGVDTCPVHVCRVDVLLRVQGPDKCQRLQL